MKILCLVGAHGTGKTTILNELKDKYTIMDGNSRKYIKKYEGLKTDDIQCQISEGLFQLINHQIFNKEFAIFSRSPIDTISYAQETNSAPFMWEIWRDKINDLTPYIEYCYLPIEFELEDDGVRGADPKHQKEIDRRIQANLRGFNVNYTEISGNLEKRIQKVKEIIDRCLND